LIDLKLHEPSFSSDDFNIYAAQAGKRMEINHEDMDVRIIGNFDVESLSLNPSFSRTGWWYSFFEGDSIEVSDVNETIMLEPGAYRLYTSRKLYTPELSSRITSHEAEVSAFQVYPNPVSGMLYMDPLAENSILTVLNCTGKVVRLLEMKGNQDQVNLSSLRPGLYILSRRCRKKAPEYVKVVKE